MPAERAEGGGAAPLAIRDTGGARAESKASAMRGPRETGQRGRSEG